MAVALYTRVRLRSPWSCAVASKLAARATWFFKNPAALRLLKVEEDPRLHETLS
jgi:hypothetical protein